MTITSLDQLDPQKSYTYADYLTWRFKERVELIKGRIFKMSPAPSANHQKVLVNLLFHFRRFLDKKSCQVFVAPFDVYLQRHQKDTVVQPDLAVICDASKIHTRGCFGSPDLVVEVLSPGNSRKEMRFKYDLYEECSIKEYWVVLPNEQIVQTYVLVDGKYLPQRPLVNGDLLVSSIFPDFSLEVDAVFEGMLNEDGLDFFDDLERL